jgi:ABC-type multidrug transport system fused ATPase/permease subunit
VTQPSSEDRSLGELVSSLTTDLSALARSEVELAKAELRDSARRGGLGAAFIAVAAFLLLLASVLLSIALAYGLIAAGLWTWLAFLIVGLLYVLVAAVLGLLARRQFQRTKPPERTIASVKETGAALLHP